MGPVTVTLLKYIRDGHIHLQYEYNTNYISKEQALLGNEELKHAIRGWINKHLSGLSNSVWICKTNS